MSTTNAPIPGSEYADDAVRFAAEATLTNDWSSEDRLVLAEVAKAFAHLAVAYEQRTANLIALARDVGETPARRTAAANAAVARLSLNPMKEKS